MTVNSKRSNITVNGEISQYGLESLTLNTTGKVKICKNLKTNNLILDVASKSVDIEDGATIRGDLSIKSKGAKITIATEVLGKIDYNAKSGKLSFKSCNQLDAKCGGADIKSLDKDSVPQVLHDANVESSGNITLDVLGNCTINQKNGKVNLGVKEHSYIGEFTIESKDGNVNLLGEYYGKFVVKTRGGDIFAEKLDGADITTSYGKVVINEGRKLNIVGGNSTVQVGQCTGSVTISTRSGDVVLGNQENDFDAKVEVNTLGGCVQITRLGGSSSIIKTDSGNIDISMSTSGVPQLKITSNSGDVDIDQLGSACSIETKGRINIVVKKVVSNMSIVGNNKDIKIQVPKSAKISITTKKDKKISVFGAKIDGKEYVVNGGSLGKNELSISSNKGDVVITASE